MVLHSRTSSTPVDRGSKYQMRDVAGAHPTLCGVGRATDAKLAERLYELL